MSDKTLLYKPLDIARKEIRLLELSTVSDTDGIRSYRLITVSLLDSPRFSALSYVWGNSFSTELILLNGVSQQVTNNLASALKHIGDSQDVLVNGRLLWADAVCINQTDLDEKKYQVPLMKDIYGSAHSVVSWLGADEWISTAFETLQIISQEAPIDNSDLEWLRCHPTLYVRDKQLDDQSLIPNHHWESLRAFTRLIYWSRIWIFQEIVLSQHLILVIPGKLMSVDVLKTALARTRLIFSAFAHPDQRRPDFIDEDMWKYLLRLNILDGSFKLIERLIVAKELLSRAETKRNERPALCILSAFTNETRATDQRDFYYSLIGVSQLDLAPDYSSNKSVQSVCKDFVRVYLTATRDSPWALLFLHDAIGQRGRDHYQLPSWAPMYHLPKEMEGRMRNPDPEAKAGNHVFDGLPEKCHPEIDGQTLRVFGACITSVSLAAYRPSGVNFWRGGQMATYLLNFARQHGAIYKTGIPVATALFATLQTNISGSYDFLKGFILLQSLRDTLDFDRESDASRVWFQINEAYLKSMPQHVDWSRLQIEQELVVTEWVQTFARYERMKIGRIFETLEGYLGLAPLDVTDCDIICVLDGASYPLALRQDGEHYIFIGECFVLGLMTGESRDLLAQRHASAKVFELV
ncbi:hypothetical protein EG329_008502 [Mollisiaceae sp. DMI_Dod_QoI]|nr:hypothetical protein EG329_008502 [Helotiales sp. DMI_Dod_QoI]